MAPNATLFRLEVELSDVDRAKYALVEPGLIRDSDQEYRVGSSGYHSKSAPIARSRVFRAA